MRFYTVSTDDVPEAVFTAVALQPDNVTVTWTLTSDVTLSYDVTNDSAEVEAVARWRQTASLQT